MSWDPYRILGISRTATSDEIKQVYRQLAQRYHPDRARSASEQQAHEQQFKEINAAYEVLRDPQKRQAWDRQHQPQSSAPEPFSSSGPRVIIHRSPHPEPAPDMTARVEQVRLLLKNKQYQAALRDIEHLHQTHSQDAQIRHWLATTYYRIGEEFLQRGAQHEAEHYLWKALQTQPRDPGLLFDVKRALQRLSS